MESASECSAAPPGCNDGESGSKKGSKKALEVSEAEFDTSEEAGQEERAARSSSRSSKVYLLSLLFRCHPERALSD
jgi:hypothetical protein